MKFLFNKINFVSMFSKYIDSPYVCTYTIPYIVVFYQNKSEWVTVKGPSLVSMYNYLYYLSPLLENYMGKTIFGVSKCV